MTDSQQVLRQPVEEFSRVCKRRKLRINENKSKAMKCTRLLHERKTNGALNEKLCGKAGGFKYLITCGGWWKDT